jgi:galactose-1-phosphate uridylyltransferase
MSDKESLNFAEAISVITKAYDRLFNTSFPYSSGIHQAPTNGKTNKHWHWHIMRLLDAPISNSFGGGGVMDCAPLGRERNIVT